MSLPPVKSTLIMAAAILVVIYAARQIPMVGPVVDKAIRG